MRPRPCPEITRLGIHSRSGVKLIGELYFRRAWFSFWELVIVGQPIPPHPDPLPEGEGEARSGSRTFLHRWIRRLADDNSPSPRRAVAGALHWA
jgi:hypothetical protein